MSFVAVRGGRLEYRFFEPPGIPRDDRTIVMLHEGLGCVAMWKQFPEQLSAATGLRVFAYSRSGHGGSDAAPQRPRPLHAHETEALEVLPDVLRKLNIERTVLLGHSDGASIALIYAATEPTTVSAVIALAPHVFVEDECITAIEAARVAFDATDLPERLAKYHPDPGRVFRRWTVVWLDPDFRRWNIERYLPSIRCPVLAVQGYQDEYGTFEQLERVARGVERATSLKLADCRHSPHRDQPERLIEEIRRFLN